MQSARIWFRQTHPPITLAVVEAFLIQLGAKFEKAEWTLGEFVVPQLHVLQPVSFLIQINDDEYVVEEAEEFAMLEGVPNNIKERLSALDCRLEVGSVEDYSVVQDEETTVFAGWTDFDPSHPKALELLRRLATKLDGIVEDNVNGTWWSP